jgi:hypothetical protein
LRRRRFLSVAVRAGLFFGLLLGVVVGGLTASLLTALVPALRLLPFWVLIPLVMLGTGLVFGLIMAFTDTQLTRSVPEDRLDPIGAVRQRITLEVPLPPDQALEAVSRVVFEDLQWAIEDRAEGHLTLRTPASFKSFGEQVTVDLHPTPDGSAVLIHSRPLSILVWVDYNKNRENVLLLRESLLKALGTVPRPKSVERGAKSAKPRTDK